MVHKHDIQIIKESGNCVFPQQYEKDMTENRNMNSFTGTRKFLRGSSSCSSQNKDAPWSVMSICKGNYGALSKLKKDSRVWMELEKKNKNTRRSR